LFAILNILQTIPSIALLDADRTASVPGGVIACTLRRSHRRHRSDASVIALVLLALAPLARNTSVVWPRVETAAAIEAGRGTGDDRHDNPFALELALALPVTSRRASQSWTVQANRAGRSLRSLIGAGVLGTFVFEGGQYGRRSRSARRVALPADLSRTL